MFVRVPLILVVRAGQSEGIQTKPGARSRVPEQIKYFQFMQGDLRSHNSPNVLSNGKLAATQGSGSVPMRFPRYAGLSERNLSIDMQFNEQINHLWSRKG